MFAEKGNTFRREVDSKQLEDIGDIVFQERGIPMKALYTCLMVAGIVFATGCNQSTTGGKPGYQHEDGTPYPVQSRAT